jgi:copper(I)-binding protein
MKSFRHLAFSGAFTSWIAATAWAQPIPTPPPPAAPTNHLAGAKIQFDNLMYDFGRVKSGELVKHTYYFTNTGDEVLLIKAVQPQCGCTAAGEWTKEVAPGKSGQIPIQFNSAGYSAPVLKQVTVTCNVSNQPMVSLQLKGTIFKQVDILPAFVTINVPADASSGGATVTITNNSDEALQLWEPASNNKALGVTLVTNVPGKGFQLLLRTSDPMVVGSSSAQISVKSSFTNMPVINVPAYVNVQPAIVSIPAHMSVQPAPLPGYVTNSITIQNNSQTNVLTLTEPTINYPGAEARVDELEPGRKFTLFVTFPPTFEITPGTTVEVTLKSNNPKMPVVKVPVSQIPRPVRAAAAPPKPLAPPPGAPHASAAGVKTLTPPPAPPGQ